MDYSQDEKVVERGLIHMIDNERPLKEIFNKKVYEDEFMKLYRLYQQALTAFTRLYDSKSKAEAEKFTAHTAGLLIAREEEKLSAIKSKNKKRMTLMDDTAYVALFVIPAMDFYHTEAADALADAMTEGWREHFPEHQIKRGEFEKINEGFKKRRFCYITTAACQVMGRPDDCRELTALRMFRDGWLSDQPDGPDMIRRYYDTAPAILARIDTFVDSPGIYRTIYEKWLLPCVDMAEREENARCLEYYAEMVETLEKGYFERREM